MSLSACATTSAPNNHADTCQIMGNDLPFNPLDYVADGLELGSPTELQILRVNCRWASVCGTPCPPPAKLAD